MRPLPTALCALALAFGITACGEDKKTAPATAPAAPPAAPAAPATAPLPTTSAAPAAAADTSKALASKVKAALVANKAIPGHQIDVTVKDGVVSLWGTVGDKAEIEKASASARGVEGVKSVQNNLKVVRGS